MKHLTERNRSRIWPRATLIGLALLALLVLPMMLTGCRNNNAAGVLTDLSVGAPSGGPAGPPEPPQLTLVSVFTHPLSRLEPRWSLSFDRPVAAAVSCGGDYVLVGRSYGSVRTPTQWGALVYDAGTGQELWRKTYTTGSYRTIEVEILGHGPQFAVSLFTYSNSGTLNSYDVSGKTVWSRGVTSSACLSSNPSSTSIFGVDRGRSQVFVVEAHSGRALASISSSMDATVQVSPTGYALIVTEDFLVLLSSEGRVLARVPVAQTFQDVQFAPSGDSILATTGGADSGVYRFDARGQLVWEQRIPSGGSNSLALSPDGRYALAYNVGVEHGIVLLDATDGRILRRNEFATVEDAKSQFIRWVKFLPGDGGFLVDYAVARDRAGGHSEEHSLLLFDLEAQLFGRLDLGVNVDVLVSADGTTCVTVNTVPGEYTGTNKVQLYDIRPLLGPE